MEGLSAKIPYPELVIDNKNLYEANILFPLYSGRVSETTAIMQYIYQHYITNNTYKEIAETLLEIAINEMTHHDKLGEAICMLGANPVIVDGNRFWNSGFVNYTTDIKGMIMANITGEKMAIADYELAITRLCNKSLIALIERIIIDEELHLDTLQKIYNSL